MDIIAQIQESEVTTSGQIAAGFLFASIKNIGNFAAMVNGVVLPPGEAKSYPFVGKGYQAIDYTATTTTLRIMTIV